MEAPNRNRVTAAALKYTMVSLKRIGRGVYCYNQLVVVRGWKKGEERMDLLVWLVACLLFCFYSSLLLYVEFACWQKGMYNFVMDTARLFPSVSSFSLLHR